MIVVMVTVEDFSGRHRGRRFAQERVVVLAFRRPAIVLVQRRWLRRVGRRRAGSVGRSAVVATVVVVFAIAVVVVVEEVVVVVVTSIVQSVIQRYTRAVIVVVVVVTGDAIVIYRVQVTIGVLAVIDGCGFRGWDRGGAISGTEVRTTWRSLGVRVITVSGCGDGRGVTAVTSSGSRRCRRRGDAIRCGVALEEEKRKQFVNKLPLYK